MWWVEHSNLFGKWYIYLCFSTTITKCAWSIYGTQRRQRRSGHFNLLMSVNQCSWQNLCDSTTCIQSSYLLILGPMLPRTCVIEQLLDLDSYFPVSLSVYADSRRCSSTKHTKCAPHLFPNLPTGRWIKEISKATFIPQALMVNSDLMCRSDFL